jgi:hypothetical protein
MLELSELYVLTFNIGMFCPPKALPSGGWEATRTMDRPGAFSIYPSDPRNIFAQKSRGHQCLHWPALRTQVGHLARSEKCP